METTKSKESLIDNETGLESVSSGMLGSADSNSSLLQRTNLHGSAHSNETSTSESGTNIKENTQSHSTNQVNENGYLWTDKFIFYTRMIIFILAVAIASAYGIFAAFFLLFIGKGGLGQWTAGRFLKWIVSPLTGVWFEVLDEKVSCENDECTSMVTESSNDWIYGQKMAVFIGNHQTELDILMLGSVFPQNCSVTAKSSLIWAPLLGQFMWLTKTVFIDRADRKSALAAFAHAAASMNENNRSVYIFPEGTRSYAEKPTLLPFKKGAFHLAIQAQVPIVPIVVANYSHLFNFRKQIFKSGRIPVQFLPAIPTKGCTEADVDRLMEQSRSIMMEYIEKLTLMSLKDGKSS